MPKKKEDSIACGFCHKSNDVVEKMISSPAGFKPRVYICNECVAVAQSIMEKNEGKILLFTIEIEVTEAPG